MDKNSRRIRVGRVDVTKGIQLFYEMVRYWTKQSSPVKRIFQTLALLCEILYNDSAMEWSRGNAIRNSELDSVPPDFSKIIPAKQVETADV